MILFSRKKKLQRDRNVGLVFHWRGGYAGNTGGLTLAFILASAMFALGFVTFNVYVNSTAAPSRYRASVMQVGALQDGRRWSLERKAPFLTPWHEGQDHLNVSAVNSKMYDAIDQLKERSVSWRKVPFAEDELVVPRLYAVAETSLPDVKRHTSMSENVLLNMAGVENKWEYVISSASAEGRARLPVQKKYDAEVSELGDYLGRTLEFSVNITTSGEVISCIPLKWNTEPEMKLVEQWLNTLQFNKADKAKQGVNFNTISLSVAIQVKGEEK